MPLTLRWKDATSLRVEAESLRPDALAGLSHSEVGSLTLSVGNRTAEVGELFTVEGGRPDDHLVVEGHLANVSRLGEGMTSGRLTIRGDVGSSLASGLVGGSVEVFGSVGPCAGAEMRGGLLQIHGDAGDNLGSALPGSRLGMREGVILVHGSAGVDVGLGMRRGLIAVSGSVGSGAGRGLIAGSVVIGGTAGCGLGSGLKRGTIALLSDPGSSILPTFSPSGVDRPPFLSLYLRRLKSWGWPVPDAALSALWTRFNGDLASGGQGEIWVRREA